MINKNYINKGIFFAFITSVISGVSIFYAKVAVVKIPPLVLASSRNLFVGFLFLSLFVFSKRWKEIRLLNKKQLMLLSLIAIIGGSIPFYLFFTGLKIADPQIANYIHKSLFVWVALLSYIFLKEKFQLSYWLAFFIMLLGSLFIAPAKLSIGRGEWMILMATGFWAAENILAKKILKNVSSEMIGLFRMAGGGFVLLLLSAVSGQTQAFANFNADKITVLLVGGVILFGYVYFWFKAVKLAPVSLVAAILTFSVVVGNILIASLTGLRLTRQDISYSLIIAFSMILFLLPYLKIQRVNVKFKP